MAHPQQARFCSLVRERFPYYFSRSFVLDIGSLDINGNNQFLFEDDCLYLGVDIARGKNVDIVTPGHLLGLPDETFDVIISTECLEHDRFYVETLKNIVRLLKPGGLFLMTCATTGRPEHGTLRTTPQDAPLLQKIDNEWANYYRNITEADIRSAIDVDGIFYEYSFTVSHETHDLYFYGIKNGTYHKHEDSSWLLPSSAKNRIVATLRGELDALQATNTTLRGELDALQATNTTLRGELDAVYLSKSWRITHPLRVTATRLNDFMNFGRRARNAARYLLRGDLHGLRQQIRTIRKDRTFEKISKANKSIEWCILTTPHTIFIANLIASRLRHHDFVVDIMSSAPDVFRHDMYIVLCPQMFKNLPPGEKRISFQLEQSVSSRWFNNDYFDILENSFAVFDYSLNNIEFLSRNRVVFPHIHYVPIGAIFNYRPQPDVTKKTYDVLFYGDALSSPRRRKMLDAIRRNFNLHVCSEVFGIAMVEEIKKAKIVVNIHYYENALLEMPRIQECLSLGVPVVSESAQDRDQYPEIDGAVIFFEEGDEKAMIEAIRSALDDLPKLKSNIDLAVNRSAARFAFMFDRALVALSLLPAQKVIDNDLPVPPGATHITLSMPETINRRRTYEKNKPNGFFTFDGLRARPGWIGCGLSYKALAVHGIKHNLSRLTVIEDDVLLPEDFEIKLQNVYAYLDTCEGLWDVFAGLVTILHENTQIIKCEEFGGMTFLTLNKMTSTVCNVYSRRGMHILASWNQDDKNDQTNTIDKYIERQPNLRVVVALPFLVGHREEVHSTLWGFQNTTYSSLIAESERKLYLMYECFVKEALKKSASGMECKAHGAQRLKPIK